VEAPAVTQPVEGDPFDFGLGFRTSSEWLAGEKERRMALVANALPYRVAFFDDYCRALLPHDLVLVGARSGAGKTELVTGMAKLNAQEGKRVHYFALEAFEGEIETRIKYELVCRFLWESNHPGRFDFNFMDWYLGRTPVDPSIEQQAEKALNRLLATLKTYYRGTRFGMADLRRLLLAIQEETDLIIVDHLHYVDIGDEQNENRAMRELVKEIRDVSLTMNKPVICVAHLKKREGRKVLVPDLEDFHGTSDITKIATTVFTVARARDSESTDSRISNTYLGIPKFRNGGACPYVARIGFDIARKSYEKNYILGRLDIAGEQWTEIAEADIPRWAKREARA
jgi:hypothetical protein